MNTGKAIRTLMILAATGLFATGCVTAKQASQAASEGTQATPAPATTATATTPVTPAPAATTAAVTPAPQGIVGYVVQKGDHLWGLSAKPAAHIGGNDTQLMGRKVQHLRQSGAHQMRYLR